MFVFIFDVIDVSKRVIYSVTFSEPVSVDNVHVTLLSKQLHSLRPVLLAELHAFLLRATLESAL